MTLLAFQTLYESSIAFGIRWQSTYLAIYGNMIKWQYENIAIWQYVNMEVWHYGNMEIWQCVNMEMWQ